MRRQILLLLLLSLLTSLIPAQDVVSSDESKIRQVVQRYLDARDRRDAHAVAELFTPDADQLVSSGVWRKGREAVVSGALASSDSTGGHRTISIQTIRFLAPTVALADGPYQMTGLAGNASRDMWTTFVLTRQSGNWRIAAIRNMRPASPVPPKEPAR